MANGSGSGKFINDIKTGVGIAVGASLALGIIKIVSGFIPIPRDFVLANAGTFNTLGPDSTMTEYHLH